MSGEGTSGTARTGGCLCGQVRFQATPKTGEMHVCHCSKCRRWAGGMFMGLEVASPVTFEDESSVGIYRSSDWAERVFCRACGGSIVWRMHDGSLTIVAAEAFDEPADFRLVSEYFHDEKPAAYALANDTYKLTGAQIVALMAGAD